MSLAGSEPLAISPHLHREITTARIMWGVTACLLPAGLWGVWQFGPRALLVVLVALLAALAGELLVGLLRSRPTVRDGSAFLTGLLVGYLLPPGVPLYVPAAASLFGILVVKGSFGGLGNNWMNPAIAGTVFAFFSWSAARRGWIAPLAWSPPAGASWAEPLAFVKSAALTSGAHGPIELLASAGYPVSRFSQALGGWLHGALGLGIDAHYLDLLFGCVPGSIGEVSPLLLGAGSVYLFRTGIITWHVPASLGGTFLVLVAVFGGLPYGAGFFAGNPVFHLLSGSLALSALYMACDPATSPMTAKGKLIFGAGVGALGALLRLCGSAPDGLPLAIILMNIATPLINGLTGPGRFGGGSGRPRA